MDYQSITGEERGYIGINHAESKKSEKIRMFIEVLFIHKPYY